MLNPPPPKKEEEEAPKETEKPAAWSSLVKDGSATIKEIEKKEGEEEGAVVEKADDARVFRKTRQGRG